MTTAHSVDALRGARRAYDLSVPAQNGLRRGFTTGACATAGAAACATLLLKGERLSEVEIDLPDEEFTLRLPVERVGLEAEGVAFAELVKDAGDDPDQTHRARLRVRVWKDEEGAEVKFLRGEGVGLVTQRGLQIAPGEAAINPVPRAMITQALRRAEREAGVAASGWCVEVGCENGAEIAKRTFNPRLGIEGGISILGTTGIVEPKSMAAYKAAIEIYVNVALGDGPKEVALVPGNLGQKFAQRALGLELKQIVQLANFVGFGIDCVEKRLREMRQRLPVLWLAGHPGKLAKILVGADDTHSGVSASAVAAVAERAERSGVVGGEGMEQLRASTTVEGQIELMQGVAGAHKFWAEIQQEIAEKVALRLSAVETVRVKLFAMNGAALDGVEQV